MSDGEPNDMLIHRGLVLQWQGPSLYESQNDLEARDGTGISPGDGTKSLRLLRQLRPHPINGPVWLCETSDRQGQAIRVVLKLFSPTLCAQPDLEYYVTHKWTAETLWRKTPGPETVMYRENTAYSRLKHMQGDGIPTSYGFYRFTFPPNTLTNPVFAHVTEYVAGYDPHELIWDLAEERGTGDIHIQKILKCIFALYNSIHAEGVAHQDIACRNMRIVWNRQAGTDPRVVIFDFDRVKFGRDDRSIFRKEETTLNRFLLELGAWQNGDVVTSWLEEGDGKLLYRNFGSNLLTSQGTQFRAQELAYMEMCRTQNVEEERAERTKTAWREIYDSQFKSNWPLEQALVTGPTTQEVPRLTDEELALQQSNNN